LCVGGESFTIQENCLDTYDPSGFSGLVIEYILCMNSEKLGALESW
jgi:hypothetical protein